MGCGYLRPHGHCGHDRGPAGTLLHQRDPGPGSAADPDPERRLPDPNTDADTFAVDFAVAEGDSLAIAIAVPVADANREWRLRYPVTEAFRFAVTIREPDEVAPL